jgi:hypothetical protein
VRRAWLALHSDLVLQEVFYINECVYWASRDPPSSVAWRRRGNASSQTRRCPALGAPFHCRARTRWL